MRGDVNGDGAMDAVDALAVLTHVVGRALPPAFAVQPQGDVSRDGAVTAADALLMLEYRVGRDRAVAVRITSPVTPVDVADSLVLSAEVRGIRGDLRDDAVQWTCPDSVLVRECGPRVARPAIRATPSPVPLRVIASAGSLADTLEASVVEQPVPLMVVDLSPHAGAVWSDVPLSQTTHAIRAIPGGTTVVLMTAQLQGGVFRRRIPRLAVDDTTVFTARVGEVLPGGGTTVLVTGRRPGAGILTFSVNGVTLPVKVDVAAPAALACAPGTTLALDLAPGEVRTFRGSDPGAPGCLDFRADRDRGRQYMVLMQTLPYATGRAPNSALELFDFEGQALFYGAGEAIPAAYPVLRVYTPDVRPASLALASHSGPAAAGRRGDAGHQWRVGGRALREGTPRRERAVRQVRPGRGARGGTGGPRLNQTGTELIAVGDTLVSGAFARLDRGVRTTDGAPASDRAVVTYVGTALVLAEHLDVLRGRLIDADGRVAAPIPPAEHARLDAAYAGPRRQLDRLFGGPYTGTVAGRNGGGRDLAVNMPLQGAVWGYAYADLTTINYWTSAADRVPGPAQAPVVVAEELLAHEFTHVRHFQQWTDLDGPVGPWLVEGFADMGTQLAHAARVLRSETPSRTGRASTMGTNPAALPSMNLGSTSSVFAGYDRSSFVFAYLADQVEASGGDALGALRDLALAGHSRTAAEQAVRRHLPGLSLTEVIARAEVARHLEFLRRPPCRGCLGTAPAALRIAPDLPAHTRYLQFDLPPLGLPTAYQADLWPVLRPGAPFGTAFQLRTGGAWPLFIDGTAPLGDAQYLLDLSGERQTVFSVVRIR
ncbi:dockerin type I repeat-containing protein, partial [Longimicrobium sp.]|uniref:dockerin type I repeat-containing protein n=1 Tax=Longimicrobium sp. TaxID=2029185 RepID=UPI002E37D864